MEALLRTEMIEEMQNISNGRVIVEDIVTDDDSTLHCHCCSQNNGGKLRDRIRVPKFLADSAHRTKVMAKPVFAFVSKQKKSS